LIHTPNSQATINICVIVVLYQRSLAASPTCVSLLNQEFLGRRDLILVYDNSSCSSPGPIPEGWELVNNASNGGLSAAYSYAIARAKEVGCPWILLLDQDTELPADFLLATHRNVAYVDSRKDVVAVIPIIKAGEIQLSPMLPRIGRENPFTGRDVVETQWLMAINSGTCIRVEFIESIGGFSPLFWLDYLDHWLFKMIHNQQRSVYVGSLVLQHDLSVANMNEGMTVQRYRNVLRAERQFTNAYLPPLWRLALIPRLVLRAMKHLVRTREKRIALLMAAGATEQTVLLAREYWKRLSKILVPATKQDIE
jgi:GT2 family glycosyltransferase